MPELDVPGATLNYETAGHISLPAILLIMDAAAEPEIEPIVADHFVIRFLLTPGARTRTVDDAIDLLDHLGIATARVTGFGGARGLADDIVREHPDRAFASD
jgi:3-oxoadipate enol-lactonase